MESFLPFFLLLFAGVVFSVLSQRLHVPWVVALILGGIALGPEGMALLEVDDTVQVIAEVGLIFLMFMAGLEVKFSAFKHIGRDTIAIALLHGLIPFGVGYGVGWLLELAPIVSMLIGVIFVSTSVAVVYPALDAAGLLGHRISRTIITSTIIADVAALILLTYVLQRESDTTSLPLPIFFLVLFGALTLLRLILPAVDRFLSRFHGRRDVFQQELRTALLMLAGTVVLFEFLGLHPIIAGFFAGSILADVVSHKVFLGKLRALSYGFFIPVFFVVVGTQLPLGAFLTGEKAIKIAFLVVVAGIGAKVLSGWVGARISGFPARESWLVGWATVPQLATTLAVVYTMHSYGLLTPEQTAPFVLLGMITTVLGPLMIGLVSRKL